MEAKREELSERFLSCMQRTMRGMHGLFRAGMEEHGVTLPQFLVLKMVKKSVKVTVSDVSTRLMVTAPTASRMVDGLCGKGLVAKEKDPDDHRVTYLKLTPESELMFDGIMERQRSMLDEVFGDEPDEALEQCLVHLDRIADRLFELNEAAHSRSGARDG